MKTKNLMVAVGLILSMNSFATDTEIILIHRSKSGDTTKQFEVPIPVRADLSNSLLGIHFAKKVKQVFVTVSGPNGSIYQKEVTTENAKSIYVDLAQYQEGEYNIYFQDAEGNEVSGDFLKDTEE